MKFSYNLSPVSGQKSFYGEAIIHVDADGNQTLQSYNTTVCTIDENNNFVRHWNGCSATTMRHIRAFLAYNPACAFDGSKKEWDALPTISFENWQKRTNEMEEV